MPKLNTELEEILRVFLTKTAQGASKATREMWVKHANTQLTALIDRKVAEGRISEVEALYARADKDPELRDKLDNLYIHRYENLGGDNIFILDRLKTLTQQEEKK